MNFNDEVLERLAPAQGWVSDWSDILERAGERRSARLLTKRRLIMVVAVLAAVLVPLAAFGSANEWWFLRFGSPAPTKEPFIVKEGEWDGHAWQLIAYPSTTDGLCFGMTPKGSNADGEGGAMACAPIAGVARTAQTKASPDMSITYLAGSGTEEGPPYIVGPVIAKASTVEIRFGRGDVLRVPTFAGVEPLQNLRFYAAQLPSGLRANPTAVSTLIKWVAGLDADGNVVACLAPQTAVDGISRLSDCR